MNHRCPENVRWKVRESEETLPQRIANLIITNFFFLHWRVSWICSNEGLTPETSATHQTLQAKNIPYQPLLIKPMLISTVRRCVFSQPLYIVVPHISLVQRAWLWLIMGTGEQFRNDLLNQTMILRFERWWFCKPLSCRLISYNLVLFICSKARVGSWLRQWGKSIYSLLWTLFSRIPCMAYYAARYL